MTAETRPETPTPSRRVPTVRSVDHVSYTVPDLEQAITFFVAYLGAELIYRDGPFGRPGEDYMRRKLNVHPDATSLLAMLRMGRDFNLELIQYQTPGQRLTVPSNSDVGGSHLALYVDDIDEARAYLCSVPGVTLLEGPNGVAEDSPVAGQRWFYFLTPWGMTMELTSDSAGNFYGGLPGAAMAPPTRWNQC
jgi:catechol 2,3-dioxygenase-like lactoylglutathione lyase family enzyme